MGMMKGKETGSNETIRRINCCYFYDLYLGIDFIHVNINWLIPRLAEQRRV